MKSVSQKDVTKKLHVSNKNIYSKKSCKFHLLQSCFKPGRLYCWMDKMLRKLGCFAVKEWNSCGIYLISTNLTYFVHLKSLSRNTSGSMLFASQLNFFFWNPKKLGWLAGHRIFRWFQATSQAKAIWSSAANSCTTTRRGRLAAMGGRRSSPKATRSRRFR